MSRDLLLKGYEGCGITDSQWPYYRLWLWATLVAEAIMLLFHHHLFLIYLIIASLFLGGLLLRVFKLYPGQWEPLILDFSAVVIAFFFAFLAWSFKDFFWRFLLIFCSSAIIWPHFLYIAPAFLYFSCMRDPFGGRQNKALEGYVHFSKPRL